MELNDYQKEAKRDIETYLSVLNSDNNLIAAWKDYWAKRDIRIGLGGVPPYNDAIPGVPHICMKVPTGGGKTFMACAAVKPVMDSIHNPGQASCGGLARPLQHYSNTDYTHPVRSRSSIPPAS